MIGARSTPVVGAAVLSLLSFVATACLGRSLRAGSGSGQVLRVAIAQPSSLDPVLASHPQEAFIARQLFDGLVRLDDTTAGVIPDVATSWETDASNTVFTFHLRTTSRFSNGEAVTAASFVRGFTRALAPGLARAQGSLSAQLDEIAGAPDVERGQASVLAGARALDDHTLEIRLSAPDTEFLVRCAGPAFSPIPSSEASEAADPSWGTDPVGNGPFHLEGPLVRGQPILLDPSPLHVPGRAKTKVTLGIYADPGAAYAAWRAGRLDWTAFPPEKTAEVRRTERPDSLIRPTAGLDALVMPVGSGPTANLMVREALSMAIDRRAIANGLLTGAVLPARGLVPQLVPGSASAGGAMPCGACTYDPAQARTLLAQSGVTVTGVFPIAFDPASGQGAWVHEVAAELRANLGIDAEVVPSVGSGAAETGVAAVMRPMLAPVPDDLLGSLPGSRSLDTSGYGSPSLETALAAARALPDPGQRAAAFAAVERGVLNQLPVIPLFWLRDFRLARVKDWRGLAMDTFGDPTLRSAAPA